MKKLLCIMTIMAMTGCSVSLFPGDYVAAEKLCAGNDGVSFIFVASTKFTVSCNNGAVFSNLEKHRGKY